MKESRMVTAQLQKRDPLAWSVLLRERLGKADVVVTAVSSKPLRFPSHHGRVSRYLLALEGHSDPITVIGKRTTPLEVQFYQHLAPQLPRLTPPCYFIHPPDDTEIGWLVLADVPNDISPERWGLEDVEAIITRLADYHAVFWGQEETLERAGLPHFLGGAPYTWEELRQEQAIYFDQGPAAMLSDHALQHAGQLAPLLLKAANGVAVMRALGGWPGILGESHLAAAADLLDDPAPMLEPLRQLPPTLLHGAPHSYHWQLSLFDDVYLLDWQKAAIGPGICDLVNFLEQFELLYADGDRCNMGVRPFWPLSEETMVDSYLIGMRARLGPTFQGRAVRQALSAARCLYVLVNWFALFAEWFAEMPNPYVWQKINTLPEDELMGSAHEPIARVRPYLQGVYGRFLQAYRSL
ncbi:MAG: hypothetical protein D8M54_16015 [Chloroflexi bacterium]|nr:hypothetical protein [Chloroflexota bacterium]